MSGPLRVTCLFCETGELRPDPFLVRCSGCDRILSREMFKTLRQIRGLQEVCLKGGCIEPETARDPDMPERPGTRDDIA